MLNFSYKNNSKIIFGKNSIKHLKEELMKYQVKKLLLISGSENYIYKLGIYDEITNICNELEIKLIYNNEVVSNPKIELVRKLVKISKEENVDFVLAVGGGSAIDTAKAVAIGSKTELDVWKFYTENIVPKKALKIGVISTLAGSGSEISNCSIISSEEYKLGFEHELIVPTFAIIDIDYMKTLPKSFIFSGICDISTHLLERYYTNIKNVDTTDFMIEGLLKALIINAIKLTKNIEDENAKNEIFLISLFAHNNLLDSGRIADWASHRIEHELSNEYGINHGEGMAIVMVAYTKYMAKIKPEKLAQLSNRVFNVDYATHSLEEMAIILSEKIEDFYKKLNLKTKLNEINIDNSKFLKMAKKATQNNKNTIGHYFPLSEKEIIEVLEMAL